MHLLHTTTLEFKEFFDEQVPKYAILSHRWEDEEVLFQDMKDGNYQSKKGYPKLKGACDQAAKYGHQYIWIDTCCIDKSSSAELTEAINSMFLWYQKSHICYAYISDVPCRTLEEASTRKAAFRNSKWFTRGWTLQELIAPNEIIFFDQVWEKIGTKYHGARTIEQITGIAEDILQSEGHYKYSSVAQKMSWLAKRTTTRVEDMAYCMLGLFGVYMSPLYGEGQNAFQRLQLEILKISGDESIFAWKADPAYALKEPYRGLLARSASEFENCGSVVEHYFRDTPPYAMTNKGMGIMIPLEPRSYSKFVCTDMDEHRAVPIYVAKLNCRDTAEDLVDEVGIFLKKHEFIGNNSFSRVFPHRHSVDMIFTRPTAFIGDYSQDPEPYHHKPPQVPHGQTIYFQSSLAYAPRRALSKFRKFQLFGEELQSFLSELITIDKAEHWVEYEPFKFLQHAIDGKAPTAMVFTCNKLQETNVNASEDCVVVLFYQEGEQPVTRILPASVDTIRSWKLLQQFLRGALADKVVKENPPRNMGFPSHWLKNRWSIYIPNWGKVLDLWLSDDLTYTLRLMDPEEEDLKPPVTPLSI